MANMTEIQPDGKKRRFKWIIHGSLLLGILCVVSFLSLIIGSADITIGRLFSILFSGGDSLESHIVMFIRLPRLLMALAVGGSLGLSGVLLQSIFRNPLVEPYTLGISGGAALGVGLVLSTRINLLAGIWTLPLSGFIGAISIVLLVYFLANHRGMIRTSFLLLMGVMLSFITSSLLMLLLALTKTENLQGIIYWIMGSLEEPNKSLVFLILVISVLGLSLSYIFSLRLNALSVGEEEARHLGIDTERTKKYIFILASLLAGCCVAVSGVIGFVGLVVPHFVRMLVGHDHRILLISAFLSGSIFLILCDAISRTIISPIELPVGVITGILGGGIFIYTLFKRRIRL